MQDDNHEGKIDQTANRKLGEDRKLAVRWQKKEKEGIVQFTSIHAEPTLACRGRAVTSDNGDFRWARLDRRRSSQNSPGGSDPGPMSHTTTRPGQRDAWGITCLRSEKKSERARNGTKNIRTHTGVWLTLDTGQWALDTLDTGHTRRTGAVRLTGPMIGNAEHVSRVTRLETKTGQAPYDMENPYEYRIAGLQRAVSGHPTPTSQPQPERDGSKPGYKVGPDASL